MAKAPPAYTHPPWRASACTGPSKPPAGDQAVPSHLAMLLAVSSPAEVNLGVGVQGLGFRVQGRGLRVEG